MHVYICIHVCYLLVKFKNMFWVQVLYQNVFCNNLFPICGLFCIAFTLAINSLLQMEAEDTCIMLAFI